MKKNVASQAIGAQMIAAADGAAFTDTVTVYITIDNGTQTIGSVGSGVCTHEGNGYHSYAPAQAETNGDHIAFTFIGTGAIPATVQVYTNFPQTVDNNTLLGTIDGKVDTVDTVVDAIKVVTDALPDAGALTSLAQASELTKVPKSDGTTSWNATALAAINAQADLALTDYDPPTKAELDSAHSTTNGKIDTAQADLDILTGTDGVTLATSQANYAPSKAGDAMALTAGAVDAIWDEDVDTSHQTAGTAGKKLDDAGAAGDPWATALPGAYGAGTAGNIVGNNLDAPVSTVDTVVDGIQADLSNGTDGLGALKTLIDAIQTDLDNGTDGLGALKALIDTVDGVVDAILVDTAEIGTAGAGLTDLGGMSTAMKAEVLSEVNDALDAAISELGVGAPSNTPSLRNAAMALYMALINKLDVTTSGDPDHLVVHNAAGTAIFKKVLTDDGSDYSEAKAISG